MVMVMVWKIMMIIIILFYYLYIHKVAHRLSRTKLKKDIC